MEAAGEKIRSNSQGWEDARVIGERQVRDVIDDATGVPLFVEEVTRLLLERGEQGGAQAIPPTLQQSLMARLDRARSGAGADRLCDWPRLLLQAIASRRGHGCAA
jgi:hypothetical protein